MTSELCANCWHVLGRHPRRGGVCYGCRNKASHGVVVCREFRGSGIRGPDSSGRGSEPRLEVEWLPLNGTRPGEAR